MLVVTKSRRNASALTASPERALTRGGEGVKLGDSGLSRVLDTTGDLARTAVGTPCYMAPELLDERPYDYKADVWSVGCVLFELLQLKRAFEARSMPALVRLVLRGDAGKPGFPKLGPSASAERV